MGWKVIVAAVLASTAAGCAVNAPYLAGADLPARVRAALPATDRDIEVFGHAGWYPYMDGKRATGHERPIRGGLVVTDAALLFVIWDEDLQRIDVAKRIAFADITTAEVDRLGYMPVLLVRLRDRNMHSFGFEEGGRWKPVEPAMASLRSRMARKAAAS